jgi:hypothetical protein
MAKPALDTVFLVYQRDFRHSRDDEGSFREAISVYTTLKGENRAAERLFKEIIEDHDEGTSFQTKEGDRALLGKLFTERLPLTTTTALHKSMWCLKNLR